MKKLLAFLVVSLFLVSVVPLAVFAVEGRNGGSDSHSDDVMVEGEVDLESETEVDSSDGAETEIRERTRVRTSDGSGRSDERVEQETRMESKFEDIREHQRERIEAMIAKCKEADDPARCEAILNERLELISKLEAKDLDLIEKLRARSEAREDDLEEVRKHKAYAKFRHEFKARAVAKERLQAARAEFEEAREAFVKAREEFRDEKEAFLELKTRVKTCEGEETEECNEVRTEIKLKAKGMTADAVNMMIEHLEKLKATIQESEHMTEAEVSAAVQAIDAKIAKLEELLANVDAVTAETSKEDVQALAKEAAVLWKSEIEAEVKHRAGFVMASRIGGTVVRSEQLVAKFEKVFERAAEKRIDTTSVQAQVDSFNALVDEARAAHEKAVALFEEASKLRGEARNTKLREAHAALKEAKEKLKDAHDVLKDVAKALREKKLDDELEE